MCERSHKEVVATLTDLVRAGKIRHSGFSDVPAWSAARARTLAECQGKEPVIALQLEYSLVERTIEREHVGAARELGLAICPWSPLAGGFLAGKYRRTDDGPVGEGRLAALKDTQNPAFQKFTERNWKILDAVLETASAVGRSPAEVALSWLVHRPGITSTIIGATKLPQLESNLAALDVTLPIELSARLDEASALDPAHPYMFFSGPIQSMVHGGVHVRVWGASAGD